MGYQKPHLTFERQLALLESRGLDVSDRADALQLLRAVGYYRLSAYVYPFRQLLPAEEQRVASPAHYRSEEYVAGATYEAVRALWQFDRRLRLVTLDALEAVEISLRTSVAYVLGERDPFGHVNRDSLDRSACNRRSGTGSSDAFTLWESVYQRKQDEAAREDFVRHHLGKYGQPLPVWIAVEFLDFGALVRLARLMRMGDQNEVARMHGVTNGTLFAGWMRNLSYLRNVCAHHSRLWNRTLTYPYARWRSEQTPASLAHAAAMDRRDKVYIGLAIAAALVRHIQPESNWPLTLRTVIRKFPETPHLSPEGSMGFPHDWGSLPLWNSAPQHSG
jgi:abortive infection bacteriophage resistance protein